MRTLLIDADTFAYAAASANEDRYDWGAGVVSSEVDQKAATDRLDREIRYLKNDLEADEVILCLTDSTNFRKQLYPDYKAHRKAPKPALLGAMREHLHANYRVYQKPGLEADDCVGILATSARLVPGEKVVVSIDKDLRGVPCRLFNPQHPERGIEEITEQEADTWHAFQTLVGDSCDGYPGCPKVGPVKAEKILTEAEEHRIPLWAAVFFTFLERGLYIEDALTQARLARILRASDYDFKAKQPKMWSPRELN